MDPPTPPIAVYDACVLYPAPLRDLLMHLTLAGGCDARWTDRIHDEWTRSVLAGRPDLTAEKLARTRGLMDQHAPGAKVAGYEGLIAGLSLPDPNDRHVLAAAIRAGAGVIVTFNLRDFPADALRPHGVSAEHPDGFVAGRYDADPHPVRLAAARHRRGMRRPPATPAEYLEMLERQRLPETAARLRNTRGPS